MIFNVGDFVEFRNSRWVVINISEDLYDLMNGYQEEHWNAHLNDLTLIAKFR